MAAVTSLILTAAALAGTAYTAKRGRDQALHAKKTAKNQMLKAEHDRQVAGERAEADAGRDMASVRRRLVASFGRGANIMKPAPQEGGYGKSLIGS